MSRRISWKHELDPHLITWNKLKIISICMRNMVLWLWKSGLLGFVVLQDVVNDRIKHCVSHVAGDADECAVCVGTGKCRLYWSSLESECIFTLFSWVLENLSLFSYFHVIVQNRRIIGNTIQNRKESICSPTVAFQWFSLRGINHTIPASFRVDSFDTSLTRWQNATWNS